MICALGGNRPVGPACESDYRTGGAPMQYDGVLANGCRGSDPMDKPLKIRSEGLRGVLDLLGHMA